MSLTLLHRRRSGGQTKEYASEIDTNTSFLIKNETTSAQRSFTYAEIIDGTYDTWLSGANGGVLSWTNNGITLTNGSTSYVRLKSNSGSPYLNDWEQQANLHAYTPIDMSQDWVITVILDRELNGNNQRLNLGVRQDATRLFGLQLEANGVANVVIDRSTGGSGLPDYKFSYPYTTVFKLFTFSKIAGVFKVDINNVDTALNSTTDWLTTTNLLPDNYMTLGNRGTSGSGKVTNYKHFKVLTGDLSELNRSAYNQAIMTKYGI